MEPIKKIKINKPIILIKFLDNDKLLIVTSQTTIKYLDKDTLNIISGFKANIVHARYRTKVVSFSNDGNYFASISADCRESKLYNTKTKKGIAKVNRHQGEVSCVAIDPLNNNMFSCGDDGKTFVIDIKSGKLAFTLPPHADTINDIVFSDNGQWVATLSYDKKISIFHLAMMTPKHRLKGHYAPVMKAQFLNDHRLFSVDKDSKGIVWNIYTGKILARLHGIHDDVIQITKSGDGKFLFLGTVLGYVMVYELETYTLILRRFLKLDTSISAMNYDRNNNQLIVGTDNGELLFYSIYKGEGYLNELLQKNRYKDMEELIKTNPFLQYTKAYKSVSSLWDKTVQKAKIYLQNGNKKMAMELFKPFEDIQIKNKIIQNILKEYAEFDKFVMLIKEEKIPLAYSMANVNPMYKDSDIYKNLEFKWKKSFSLAQKYLIKSNDEDKAREILAPYRGISEKTLFVQDLFSQSMVYKRFKIYLVERKFKLIFGLIDKFSFLKEFPEYDALMRYADVLYVEILKLIKEDNINLALKKLHILNDFSDFSEEVKEIMLDIEQKQKFFDAIKEHNIVVAYNLMATSDDLQNTQDGIRLQERWNNNLTKANIFASKGEVKEVKKILHKYMCINSKYMSLATIFGWCYMVQLEQLIKNKTDRVIIEKGIKNYILFFGLQDQILSFFEIFKKYYPNTKLNLEYLNKGSIKLWKPSVVVDSILD